MDFEWDLSQEMVNLREHGVSVSEVVETFFDAYGSQLTDRTHSTQGP